MSKSAFCIFGAGGHARDLVAQIHAEAGREALACLVDEYEPGRTVMGVPVLALDAALAAFPVGEWLIALGDPAARRTVARRLSEKGARFGVFRSRASHYYSDAAPGPGSQVFAGVVVSAEVRIGAHCLVNYNCTLSHEVTLADFVTLSPAVSLAGRVAVGEGTFIGVGATALNGPPGGALPIGENVVIGAGACVVKPVPAGMTVVGVPARPIAGRA